MNASSLNDDLSRRLHGDDETAIKDILNYLGPRIDRLLCREFEHHLTQDDRDDIISMMLYICWKHRHSYQPERSQLQTWLYRIAARLATSILRTRASQHSLEVAFATHSKQTPTPLPQSSDLSPEQQRQITDAIDALHAIRTAYKHIVVEDINAHSGTAAAKLIEDKYGIPHKHVPMMRKRAYAQLRKVMHNKGYLTLGNK